MHTVGIAADSAREVPLQGCGSACKQPARDRRDSTVHGRMALYFWRKRPINAANSGRFSQYITAM
jgi:hypothetical protein